MILEKVIIFLDELSIKTVKKKKKKVEGKRFKPLVALQRQTSSQSFASCDAPHPALVPPVYSKQVTAHCAVQCTAGLEARTQENPWHLSDPEPQVSYDGRLGPLAGSPRYTPSFTIGNE